MKRLWYIILPSMVLLGWWLFGKDEPVAESARQIPVSLPQPGLTSTQSTSLDQQPPPDLNRAFKLTFGLKALFDQFIFEHELLSIDQLVQAYAKFIKQEKYAPQSHRYAVDLFERYVNYKATLVEIDDETSANSLQEIADRLEARNDLRFRFFNEQEHHYLFAKDAAYDKAALERLRIASDASLSKTDKQRLIEEQLATLPREQQASFAPSLAVNRLATLQQHYTNEEVRFQAVAAEFGHDVAQRLNEQSKQHQSWLKRVKVYQQWHSQLLSTSTLTAAQLKAQINQKQQTMFSEPEQRRLVVYMENPSLLSEN